MMYVYTFIAIYENYPSYKSIKTRKTKEESDAYIGMYTVIIIINIKTMCPTTMCRRTTTTTEQRK